MASEISRIIVPRLLGLLASLQQCYEGASRALIEYDFSFVIVEEWEEAAAAVTKSGFGGMTSRNSNYRTPLEDRGPCK